MTMQLMIQHVTGSKANQVEPFPYDTVNDLTLGRDPACSVVFDPQRDDAVSRQHAVIKIVKGDRVSFSIVDLNSSNGTYVNGTRITSENELLPGDTVQLGQRGPSFMFDVQPRPAHLVARTRVVFDRPGSATRIEQPAATTIDTGMPIPPPPPPTAVPPPSTARSGVGRETVHRMLAVERQSLGRKWMVALAAVVVLALLGGGGLYYRMQIEKNQTEAQLAAQLEAQKQQHDRELRAQQEKLAAANEANTAAAAAAEALKTRLGVLPSEIVRSYGDSTVYVSVQWRLYDRDTGKALYHRMVDYKGTLYPAYIRVDANHVVRWLTTEDDNHRNKEVGARSAGTGFVIDPNGYILTNRHVAAGWQVNYNNYAQYEQGQGLLFQQEDKLQKKEQVGTPFNIEKSDFRDIMKWTPQEGGQIFDAHHPVPVGGTRSCACVGRNELLEVQFPGSRDPIEARLVRVSQDADVALIKIDSGEALKPVQLASDNTIVKGGSVTVLGYPQSSVENVALHQSIEAGEVRARQASLIPEPTVTPGVISALSLAEEKIGDVTVIGPMGELYQLTAATSYGNSGGPVFDSNGKVIAIFTYGSSRETVTLAVPIHFGRSLLPVQRQQ